MKAIQKSNILSRPGRLAFNSILVLAMLAAFLPQTALAASSCQSYYTVRSGDTTPSISHIYGFKWKVIAAANDMQPNEKPSIGQILCIPSHSEGTKATKSSNKTPNKGVFLPANEGGALFTVRITRNQINTTLSNFSNYHIYKVKVRASGAASGGWYNLGNITIITLARQSFSFDVPKDLKDTTNLIVCFKDQISGALVCRKVLNL